MKQDDKEEVLEMITDAGHVMVENGAEISRVEEAMYRMAAHYGIEGEHFFVLSNGIFTTANHFAKVEYIPIKFARLDKMVGINQLTRKINLHDIPFEEARSEVTRIGNLPPKPLWEQSLGAIMGCAAFCAIFGGGFMDCAASGLVGLCVYLFTVMASRMHATKIMNNLCASALGTMLCMAIQALHLGTTLSNMIVGTLIILIPGVAFTNSIRDIANEDYLAGATRMIDALMVFLCIAAGASLTFVIHGWIMGGMVMLHGPQVNAETAGFALQLAAATIGTVAFAEVFSVPRRNYLATGLVGLAGWAMYLFTLRYTSLGIVTATFFATCLVTFLSTNFVARQQKCPSTVFIVCGVFPLIPGGGVFWSAYYLVSEQMQATLQTGFLSIKLTIAIVLGIIVARNLKMKIG